MFCDFGCNFDNFLVLKTVVGEAVLFICLVAIGMHLQLRRVCSETLPRLYLSGFLVYVLKPIVCGWLWRAIYGDSDERRDVLLIGLAYSLLPGSKCCLYNVLYVRFIIAEEQLYSPLPRQFSVVRSSYQGDARRRVCCDNSVGHRFYLRVASSFVSGQFRTAGFFEPSQPS